MKIAGVVADRSDDRRPELSRRAQALHLRQGRASARPSPSCATSSPNMPRCGARAARSSARPGAVRAAPTSTPRRKQATELKPLDPARPEVSAIGRRDVTLGLALDRDPDRRARRRAGSAVARGRPPAHDGRLHSLPGYHGAYAALWAAIPALLILAALGADAVATGRSGGAARAPKAARFPPSTMQREAILVRGARDRAAARSRRASIRNRRRWRRRSARSSRATG